MLGQNWINTNATIKAEHTLGVQKTEFATPTILTSSVVFLALHMSIAYSASFERTQRQRKEGKISIT